jgi:hypothetical protein
MKAYIVQKPITLGYESHMRTPTQSRYNDPNDDASIPAPGEVWEFELWRKHWRPVTIRSVHKNPGGRHSFTFEYKALTTSKQLRVLTACPRAYRRLAAES